MPHSSVHAARLPTYTRTRARFGCEARVRENIDVDSRPLGQPSHRSTNEIHQLRLCERLTFSIPQMRLRACRWANARMTLVRPTSERHTTQPTQQ